MKTTAKKNKTIKRTLLKNIKSILELFVFLIPAAFGKITRTFVKSSKDIAKKNSKNKNRLVGSILEKLELLVMISPAIIVAIPALLFFGWVVCYAMYSIDPELCDIILDFTGGLYQHFTK